MIPADYPKIPTLFRLIYISGETNRFTRQDLEGLLEAARAKNAKLGITGLLLYRNGNFMQVLEGGEPEVRALFEEIRGDTRHRRVLAVVQESVASREFPDWSMGFREIDPERDAVPEGFSTLLHEPWCDLDYSGLSADVRRFVRLFRMSTDD